MYHDGPLDFDIPIFYSTTRSTLLFELFGKLFQLCPAEGNPANKTNSTSLATFGLSAYPDYTIATLQILLVTTTALLNRMSTTWAGAPRFSRVNQPFCF